MLRLTLILSFFLSVSAVALSAPALAEGVWLKGRNDQVWVEQVATGGPEHDTRHGFTRVAKTERPVVYLDEERVNWDRQGSSSDGPVVIVRHDHRHSRHYRRHGRYYGGSHRRYSGYDYRGRGRYGRHSYRYYSYPYPRYRSHGYRDGYYSRGSHRGRHVGSTRHGRVRHHRGNHKLGQARGLGRRQSRGFRR